MDYSKRKGDPEDKKATQKTPLKPVFHGFLLSSGKFLTPVEMEIMESLGVVRTKKFKIQNYRKMTHG